MRLLRKDISLLEKYVRELFKAHSSPVEKFVRLLRGNV